MGPLSLAAEPMVRLTGVVPSVSRTTALVVQPLGAVFTCTCKRVMVTALSGVQVAPVHVDVSAPGRKTFCSPRGLAGRVCGIRGGERRYAVLVASQSSTGPSFEPQHIARCARAGRASQWRI